MEPSILDAEMIGHVQAAVQWVSRAGKPLAMLGSFILPPPEAERLGRELEACLERFDDPCSRAVRGFVASEAGGELGSRALRRAVGPRRLPVAVRGGPAALRAAPGPRVQVWVTGRVEQPVALPGG